MPRLLWPLVILMLLSGCAYVDNSQFRNALPMSRASVSWGIAGSHNLYELAEFEPGHVDSTLNTVNLVDKAIQLPLSFDFALGKGFGLAIDLASDIGPRFEGAGYEELTAFGSTNNMSKINLHKSFSMENGYYLALVPAYAIATEVTGLGRNYRIRAKRHSVELPLVISKSFSFDSGTRVVFSLCGRAARDYIDSDLNGSVGNWMYQDYLNQPRLEVDRYAVMGSLECSFNGAMVMVQYGTEEARANNRKHRAPVASLRFGMSLPGRKN